MYVKDCLNYAVIERISEEALQALWIKIQFCGSRNTICGVSRFQQNSSQHFQDCFDETLELEDCVPQRKLYLHHG